MNEGYVKFYRKMLDDPMLFNDIEYWAIWSYLLLNATHKEYKSIFNGQEIKLKPGQLITGRSCIASKLHISQSKVQRVLKKFEKNAKIEQQTGNKNRLITIVKWNEYQSTEQQVNNKRTTSEQQANTYKNDKECIRMNKNDNIKEKYKKEKAEQKIHFAEFVSMTNVEYEKLISTYGEQTANQCIEVLDNYKGSSGKKYKSDYRAILSWVIDRVNKTKPRKSEDTNTSWKDLIDKVWEETNK